MTVKHSVNRTISLALAVLATLSVGLVLRATVLAPIRSLAEGARQFGRGQLEHRVPVHGDDELGRLSRTFNEMAAALQREIEDRSSALCFGVVERIARDPIGHSQRIEQAKTVRSEPI